MNPFGVDVRLDAASRAAIERLNNYPAILEPNLLFAMEHSIDLLHGEVMDFADSEFQNPSGQFSGSLQTSVDNPYQAQLWSEQPYAQRLEYGFSGMTDALGRYYPLWPGGSRSEYWRGYRWATRAIEAKKKEIADVFRVSIDYANWQLGRTAP